MLRLGLIGCGSIARAHAVALRLLGDDGDARLVAAADPDPAAIPAIERIAGPIPRHHTDGYELIADPIVDAVVLVAPTRVHRDLIAAAAGAGKPLFTEKPLAPTYPVVQDIVDLVERAGIPTQVGFRARFHPILRYLRRVLTERSHGEPMGYLIRDDQFWPTGAVIDGHSSWRSEADQSGGGALLEHSIHSCDIAGWLFGPVRRVYATTRHMFGYDVEDTAALVVEHESGVVGTLLTIFNGVEDREERRIEVFCERAAIEATTDFVVNAPEDRLIVKGARGPAEHVDTVALGRATFTEDGVDPDRPFHVYHYLPTARSCRRSRPGVLRTPGCATRSRPTAWWRRGTAAQLPVARATSPTWRPTPPRRTRRPRSPEANAAGADRARSDTTGWPGFVRPAIPRAGGAAMLCRATSC